MLDAVEITKQFTSTHEAIVLQHIAYETGADLSIGIGYTGAYMVTATVVAATGVNDFEINS